MKEGEKRKRLDPAAVHTGRKLFADSFLSDMAPLHFKSTGNPSQMVSYPT